LEEVRSFGGSLDKASIRLDYYHVVLDRSLAKYGVGKGQKLTSSGATKVREVAG
jgi:hypothetical protein